MDAKQQLELIRRGADQSKFLSPLRFCGIINMSAFADTFP